MAAIRKVSGKVTVMTSNNLVLNSHQKSASGLGTLSFNSQNGRPTVTLSRLRLWEPLGKDRWSVLDKDFDGAKTLSTSAYTQKLQAEEELRQQTKACQVPIMQIVKQLPRRKPWMIFNDL